MKTSALKESTPFRNTKFEKSPGKERISGWMVPCLVLYVAVPGNGPEL